MKILRLLFISVITTLSFTALAQLEVQIGGGGHFSSLVERYKDGPGPGFKTTGDGAFRPYISGLVGASIRENWNVRARVVGTSRAEKNLYVGGPGLETQTLSANYVDVGAELQWKPIPILGLSVGPYYAFKLNEQVKTGSTTIEPFLELYDNFVAVRPAVELYYGPFVVRLDASFGLSSITKVEYIDQNGQPLAMGNRFWNCASFGLSYRLIKA